MTEIMNIYKTTEPNIIKNKHGVCPVYSAMC